MCQVDTDCSSTACDGVSFTCVSNQCTDHRLDGAETDVDCGGGTCATCATGLKCKVNADCTSAFCDFVSGVCVANGCSDQRKDGAETDVDCGGGACTACLVGKGCVTNTDCSSTACDSTSLSCVSNQCADHRKDGLETDIDCGGGTCATCATGLKCNLDGDCTTSACDAVSLTCVGSQCNDHQQDGAETDTDCGGGTCTTCATGKKCSVNSDCATNACDFVSGVCVASHCFDQRKDSTETDIDCGGGCATCALGKGCSVDADCAANACNAVTFVCVSNQCIDQRKDGSETDVDCGGSSCSTCAVGKGCNVNGDCASGACDTVSGKCVASMCSDQIKDGAETDIDCGGGSYMGMTACSPCALGGKCVLDTDCASDACDAASLTCVSSQCSDQQKDGLETDVDCGGGVCPGCASGLKCSIDSDCSSNACDGVSFLCVNNQCIDHRLDGVETDVDCGGANLCARCAVGKKCIASSDCQTGHTCSSGAPHTCM